VLGGAPRSYGQAVNWVVLGVVSACGPPSTFLLVVGASGLCTPGPVRQDSVPRPSALFLLRGIRRAAPAQVTACRVVTVISKLDMRIRTLTPPALSLTITPP